MEGTRQPDIPIETISDPSARNPRLVSQEDFEKSKRELEKSNRWIISLLIAVLLVCFLAVVAFLVDAWRFHATAVREFTATLQEAENELLDLRLSRVNTRLDAIEKTLNEEPTDSAGSPDESH
jgi:hypothetical protein